MSPTRQRVELELERDARVAHGPAIHPNATRPSPCRCARPLPVVDDDGEPVCAACGRCTDSPYDGLEED